MDISIVIVNYQSRAKTATCLRSILASDLAGIEYEIIVVDNSEEDNIGSEMRQNFPDVRFIRSRKNMGMGAGNNLGFREATGKFFLVLNSDTLVHPSAIRILFDTLRDRDDIGIAGPKLLNPNGSLQYSCFRFPKAYTPILRRTFLGKFAPKHLAQYLMTNFDHMENQNVDWMLGSCLMIRASFFQSIGGFDERFFMYFEDTDLCRRAWRNGYRVVYIPSATVIHDHARGSARERWYIAPFTSRLAREHICSWMRYLWKWRPRR